MTVRAAPIPRDPIPPARLERCLHALYRIAQVLATRSGQRQMFTQVLEVLDTGLGLCRGTIMLLTPDGSELVVEAARDLDDSQQHDDLRYQRGEGITGRVLQTGRPCIVPRIADEPLFRDRIHRRQQDVRGDVAFICVPVALGSEVVGTLAVDVPHGVSASLDEEERLLSIVAGLIAHDVNIRRVARLERQALAAENQRLRNTLEEAFRPGNIIGNSKAMRLVYTRVHQVAGADATVLIRGESGTGKELVASAIHYTSPRREGPFVKVNCAALNENLLESELFGHERGAFTGASTMRIGRIEEAQHGTLFLDEIGDISPRLQVKLLRVLQEREFQRVGSNRTLRADVRILCATNRDLEAAVAAGAFREDLFYRINVFPMHLPPLRERRDDILLLADHFVEAYSKLMNKAVRRISTSAINMMFAYHWPGNVRELENCIQHAMLLSTDGVIHGHNLPPTLQTPDASEIAAAGSLTMRVAVLEKDMIIDALKRFRGNINASARELGITPRMVSYKIKKLNIDYPRLFKGQD